LRKIEGVNIEKFIAILDSQKELWKTVFLFSGFASLFLLLTFFGDDEEEAKVAVKRTQRKRTKPVPLQTAYVTKNVSPRVNSESRPPSPFVDANVLAEFEDSPTTNRLSRFIISPSPPSTRPSTPINGPAPSAPAPHDIPTTLEDALVIIDSLKEFIKTDSNAHQACTNAERKGRLNAERRLEAEKRQVTHLNAELEEYERHTTRTIVLHKNVSDLLENVETGISQLVDKMQEKGDELTFTLTVNTDEALRLEGLLKSVQEKKEVIEQEILEASIHKISKKKKEASEDSKAAV